MIGLLTSQFNTALDERSKMRGAGGVQGVQQKLMALLDEPHPPFEILLYAWTFREIIR